MDRDDTILFKLSVTHLTIIVIGTILNIAGRWIADILQAPLWLDSIGTVFCACLLGPVAGCLAGLLGFFIFQLFHPVTWLYAFACIPVSICVSVLSKKMSFRDIFQLISAGILTALTSMITLYILNILGGQEYIGNLWGDSLVSMLQQNGGDTYFSRFIGYAFIDIPDKVLTLFIVHEMLRLKDFVQKRRKEGKD